MMKFISHISLLFILLQFSCKPSEVIYKKHVIYNFTSEGFLMPDVLQTVGEAEVTRLDAGLDAGRTQCLEEALYKAKNRAVRVMLHTYLDIPEGESSFNISSFNADYPVNFTEIEYIRGSVDFSELLSRGFIALQDSRSSSECLVVFRIMEKDLRKKIKKTNLTFCVNYEKYSTIGSFTKRKNFCATGKNKLPAGFKTP